MILKEKPEPGWFAVMHESIFMDDRLSKTEIRILGYLMSRTVNWKVRPTQLADALRVDIRSIERSVRRLEEYGYMKPVIQDNGSGFSKRTDHFVNGKAGFEHIKSTEPTRLSSSRGAAKVPGSTGKSSTGRVVEMPEEGGEICRGKSSTLRRGSSTQRYQHRGNPYAEVVSTQSVDDEWKDDGAAGNHFVSEPFATYAWSQHGTL